MISHDSLRLFAEFATLIQTVWRTLRLAKLAGWFFLSANPANLMGRTITTEYLFLLVNGLTLFALILKPILCGATFGEQRYVLALSTRRT
jgi:hypothetical protein